MKRVLLILIVFSYCNYLQSQTSIDKDLYYEVRIEKNRETKFIIGILKTEVKVDCHLWKSFDPLTENLGEIKKNTEIELLAYCNGYWKTTYNGNIGYVSDIYLASNTSMIRIQGEKDFVFKIWQKNQ